MGDAAALGRGLQDPFVLCGSGEEGLVQFRASSGSPGCQWELQKKGRAACAVSALPCSSSAPVTLVCYKMEKSY